MNLIRYHSGSSFVTVFAKCMSLLGITDKPVVVLRNTSRECPELQTAFPGISVARKLRHRATSKPRKGFGTRTCLSSLLHTRSCVLRQVSTGVVTLLVPRKDSCECKRAARVGSTTKGLRRTVMPSNGAILKYVPLWTFGLPYSYPLYRLNHQCSIESM